GGSGSVCRGAHRAAGRAAVAGRQGPAKVGQKKEPLSSDAEELVRFLEGHTDEELARLAQQLYAPPPLGGEYRDPLGDDPLGTVPGLAEELKDPTGGGNSFPSPLAGEGGERSEPGEGSERVSEEPLTRGLRPLPSPAGGEGE